MSNGGRFYLDIHNLLEYATPECASFADVVHAEAAGDIVVQRFLDQFVEAGIISKYQHNKRSTSDGEHSIGYHENYLVERETYQSDALRILHIAQLISRTIFCGGGLLRINEHGGQPYVGPAQKLSTVSQTMSGNTTKNKPIFNTRDEPLADSSKWARLHTVAGDPTILPWATWMKLGTTSLVLRLAEAGLYDLSETDVADPVTAAQAISKNADAIIELDGGDKVRAIDIQESLVEQVEWLADYVDLPEEEIYIFEEWKKAIEDYQVNKKRLIGKVDWITRSHLLHGFMENRNGMYSTEEVQLLDQLWDSLKPGVGLAITRYRNNKHAPFFDMDQVEHFVLNPPTNTRAHVRGNMIKAMTKKERRHQNSFADWKRVSTPRVQRNLLDPYQSE